MTIGVSGPASLGTVSTGCLAPDGHHVLGVDPVPAKVELINQRRFLIESEICDIVAPAHRDGRLSATTGPLEAVRATVMPVVCVGTPSEPSGVTDERLIRRVRGPFHASLTSETDFHVVVVPAREGDPGNRLGHGLGVRAEGSAKERSCGHT